jgi:hypothetical protein
VIFRAAADGFRQPPFEFALQESHYLSDSLQRETSPPQIANYRHFNEVIHRIQPPVPFPDRHNDATLIPPLKLAGRDTGQPNYITRRESLRHSYANVSNNRNNFCLKHFRWENAGFND